MEAVVVFTGAADIGQGCNTMVTQIVARAPRVALGRVKIVAADTDLTPIDLARIPAV